MANLLLLVWAATAFSLPAFGQTSLPAEKRFTLDNGLRVFLFERDSVPLVNIVAGVNAGSKDETDETSGLVHLLEHYILFRGTDLRSGGEIARDIRNHGAVFNAHTGQDATFFEISLPSEHYEFGLKNQKEILFRLKIGEAELEAEKEVIREEIRQIEDDPFRWGRALVHQNLLAGHPYGRPVYGIPERMEKLSTEDIVRFYKRLFVPNNAVIAVVGNLPLSEMETRVREVFSDVTRGEEPPAPPERAQPLPKTMEIERELDVDEAYLLIGALGPDYGDSGQYAADVLTQVLGQGINPMLAGALNGGRRVLVNSAQMDYIALKRAGVFVAYLTLEPKNLSAVKREAVAFLRRVWKENFTPSDVLGEERAFVFDYLESAKNGIRFLVQKAWESGLGLAMSMAMHMLLNDTDAKIDYLDRIAALSSSDLRKAAAASFRSDAYVLVSIVPRKK
ncbi:MAG: pitrilysin family protein [Candidatus Aminicenantes bacterium]|nr:pitrilysin family protein [Candidatus Aminicenantes bacterium]